jgi:outer membrane receptor protein involved in Fe transport
MVVGTDLQRKTNYYRLLLISTALGGIAQLAVSTVANAQSADAAQTKASGNQIGEVVVTAERRSETVKNVPMSITAVTSATIEKFDIQDFTDYAKQAPNVSFGVGVGGGGASGGQGIPGSTGVTIRGISGYDTTAFYIDDTPLPQSLDPRVIDIDHIEVLRGPQGTLFGASSMGGLVRVITQQPNANEVSGTIDAQGYGMSHGGDPGGETSGVVNVPIAKDLASVRLSAFGSYTPGYFTRTYNDPAALNLTSQTVTGPARTVKNVGSVIEDGFGATFRVTPVDGLVLTPMLRYQKTYGDGFPLADYDTNNLVQRRIYNQPEHYSDEFYFAAFTGGYSTPFGRFVSSTSFLNRTYKDLEDGADANSGYLSPDAVLPGPSIGDGHTRTFTEEDRFESDFHFPIQVVGGVFYQLVQNRYVNTVTMPGLQGFGTDIVWNLNPSVNNTTQLAGFIGLTYTPIAPLEVQVGGRETQLTNYTNSYSTGIYGTGPGETNVTENAFTPRFSAKYRFDPQTMVYVTAAQGFRIGGANVPLGGACGGFGFSTTEQIPYGPDNLWSYEGGVKTSFLQNRLSVNADVYHIDWTKIQQSEVLSGGANGCFAGLTLNLGNAQSDGAEMEANAKITDHLTIHVAGGYEDARLTKVVPGTEYYVGEPLSGVPKWTGAISEDYEIPQSWGNYFIRTQYSFTGQSMSYTELATGLPRKAYEITDLRLGAAYHVYTLTVFAKNLFDSRPNLSDEVPVSALAADRYRYLVGLPREVGVDVRYRF